MHWDWKTKIVYCRLPTKNCAMPRGTNRECHGNFVQCVFFLWRKALHNAWQPMRIRLIVRNGSGYSPHWERNRCNEVFMKDLRRTAVLKATRNAACCSQTVWAVEQFINGRHGIPSSSARWWSMASLLLLLFVTIMDQFWNCGSAGSYRFVWRSPGNRLWVIYSRHAFILRGAGSELLLLSKIRVRGTTSLGVWANGENWLLLTKNDIFKLFMQGRCFGLFVSTRHWFIYRSWQHNTRRLLCVVRKSAKIWQSVWNFPLPDIQHAWKHVSNKGLYKLLTNV